MKNKNKNKENEFADLMMGTIDALLEEKIMDVAKMLNKAKHGKSHFSLCVISDLLDVVSYTKKSRFSDYESSPIEYMESKYYKIYRALHCSEIDTISDHVYDALVDSVISYVGLDECSNYDVLGERRNEIIDRYKEIAYQKLTENKKTPIEDEIETFLSSHKDSVDDIKLNEFSSGNDDFIDDAELDEFLSGSDHLADDTEKSETIDSGIKYLNKKPKYLKLFGFCFVSVILVVVYILSN